MVMDGSPEFGRGNIYMQIIASVSWLLTREMHKHANSCTYANIRQHAETNEETHEEKCEKTHTYAASVEVMR